MTDTGTVGTAEREVRADAGGAEGRGMEASEDFEEFEVFARVVHRNAGVDPRFRAVDVPLDL